MKNIVLYSELCAVRLIQATCYTTAKQFYFLVNSSSWNWNQSDTSIRWIHASIYRLAYMKLKIGLKNFKGVFVRVWFIIATGDRLSFDLFEIDKNQIIRWLYPGGKKLCHRWSRVATRVFFFSPTTRETEKKEPGSEVGLPRIDVIISQKPLRR